MDAYTKDMPQFNWKRTKQSLSSVLRPSSKSQLLPIEHKHIKFTNT